MKTYQITKEYSVASLSLVETDRPIILANQVLIKINAVSLNYRDLLVVKGIADWRPPIGRIPVSDGVGIIIEVGENVTAVNLNDRVAGLFFPKLDRWPNDHGKAS